MIRRIRKMLRFHAKRRPLAISYAVFSMQGSIEKIASVELHARFGGEHFHHATRRWVANACSHFQAATSTVEHEIVVVAFSKLQLLVLVVDSGADGRGLAKIKRSPLHAFQFTRR